MTRITDLSSDSTEDVLGRDYAKTFAKRMLKTHVFTGTFVEKRFVESLNSYRDVITIDDDEDKFLQNLAAVKEKIETNYLKKPWVGITAPDTIGAPVGHNLWVVLPQEIFGKYWFKVKTVEFLDNEIRLKLETLRPFKKEKTPTRDEEEDSLNFSLKEVSDSVKTNLIYFWRNVITLSNMKQSVIFISVLLSTLVLTSIDVAKYLMEYLLKLIRELSGFVRAATPLLVSIANVVAKIIYGFYSMIVALFREKPTMPPPIVNNYHIDPDKFLTYNDPRERYNKYFDRGLPYPRSNVRIKELNY